MFTVPSGRLAVVMAGATGAGLLVMLKSFVSLPALFSAFTVKLNVPAAVGVPDMFPSPDSVSPVGRLPLSRLQVVSYTPLTLPTRPYVLFTVPSG